MTNAVCRHFPACGGCRLQDMAPEAYRAHKLAGVREQLDRTGLAHIALTGPESSPPRTRRRAAFALRHTSSGIVAGFNGWRSHDIIDLQECHILCPALFALLEKLRAHLAAWLPKGKTCDARATLIGDDIDLVLVGGPPLELEQRRQLAALAEKLGVARLGWRKWDRGPTEPVAQLRPLMVTFPHGSVRFPPGGFLQATAEGERALANIAVAATAKDRKIVDLFCGIGTFALSLEPEKQIYAVDGDEAAVAVLREAARANLKAEARNLSGNPLDVLELKGYDAAIIDPPRDGARAQIRQLAKSAVRTIVSISCDAASFARDMKILHDGGYRCESAHVVDQFLWSAHIELAAVAERAG